MTLSKQVQDDVKVADAVIEAGRSYASEIAKRRHAQFIALAVGESPSIEAIAKHVKADASALEARRESLYKSDRELTEELGDDAEVFSRRDESARAVREILVEFRDVVQTACGSDVVRGLGFVGETPHDPVALETLGDGVYKKVEKEPPRSAKRGVKLDAKALVEGLPEAVAALRKSNADVRREKREEQLARARRDEAWAAFSRELSAVAASLDAQLRAVMLDDVADRLIPASKRGAPSKPEEPTPTPTPA